MKKKRILVDCHKFDEDYQGITTYIKGLYSELIKDSNYHYYFISYNKNKLSKEFGTHENVTYLKYFSKNKWIRLLLDLPFKILINKINVAHFQYVVPPIKFCRYIVTIHDVLFLDFPQFFKKEYQLKNNFLFKNSAKIADIVLTVSEYSKKRIQYYYKLKKQIFVIPNAINEDFLYSYDKQESIDYIEQKFGVKNYFLLVSRIEPRKNHLILLKSFVENKYYSDNSLVFVGKRDLHYEEFENYYIKLTEEIKRKVLILENVNNKDLVAFYQAAKIFVYPSFAEGFGIPPLESLSVNIPTICSNTTAMSDYTFFEDFLFNPNDSNDLNLKIKKALQNPNLDEIITKMRKNYNWKTSSSIFVDVINKIK
ncbi:glycosyltransferase family 4 protein [Flavobacterium jejuense]|uniref:Glycosyltransferase family 4 protein n=1 Tax=Flavobacterium jejuense TaxID=1544455 RepID=A0ABX0IRB6_9FLAO|nr:glycosyltransferase family 1 protein [Flavobacterium jejuense]NHN25615.1 glycosyltransferase family 4 protein [Flavobacterium jejuense]